MLVPQRQRAILDRVHRLGGVRVSDLVREFGVSDMTIRRDLETLAERGLVEKVHGGATALTAPAGGEAEPGTTGAEDRSGPVPGPPAGPRPPTGGAGTGSAAGLRDRPAARPAPGHPDRTGAAPRSAAGSAPSARGEVPRPAPRPPAHPGEPGRGERRPAATDEPGFAAKSMRQPREKEAIAERAAALVRPGTAVALSAGTTTWTLAHRLLDVPGLTVVTNSVLIADVFTGSGQTVVLTGGIRTPSDALVGPVAVTAIRSLNVDILFLGVHGMTAGAGFTTPNLMEAETDRAFVGAARSLVVVADHTKWETIGLSTIAWLADADVLVTDAGLPDGAREALAAEVGELVVAEPSGGGSGE